MVLITAIAIPGSTEIEENVAFDGSLKVREYFFKLLLDNIYDLGFLGTDDSPKFKFYCTTTRQADCYLMDIFVQNVTGGSFIIKISSKSTIVKSDTTTCYLTDEKSTHEYLNVPDKSFNYVKTFTFTQSDQSVGFLNTTNLDIPIRIIYDLDLCTDTVSENVELNHTFGDLILDKDLCDCTIETNDECVFKLHKTIVCIQSPILNSLFKENDYIKLDDVNKTEMELLIDFMYTNNVQDISNKDCVNLLRLAHFYEIPGLKIAVENAIITKVNSDNAIDMLCMADLYASDMLKEKALKFLSKDTSVLDTTSWKWLNETNPTKALFEFFCQKIAA